MRGSRRAYSSAIATVRSDEASSQTISSKSVNVCARTLSMASAMYCSRLYEVIRTLTVGVNIEKSARPAVRDAVRELGARDFGQNEKSRALERWLLGSREVGARCEREVEAEILGDANGFSGIVGRRLTERVRECGHVASDTLLQSIAAAGDLFALRRDAGRAEPDVRRRVRADLESVGRQRADLIDRQRR